MPPQVRASLREKDLDGGKPSYSLPWDFVGETSPSGLRLPSHSGRQGWLEGQWGASEGSLVFGVLREVPSQLSWWETLCVPLRKF